MTRLRRRIDRSSSSIVARLAYTSAGAVAVVVWVAVGALGHLSGPDVAPALLEDTLRAPTSSALHQALAGGEERVVADADLVAFDLPRADVEADVGAAENRAARQRAEELYRDGPPADPGPNRTLVGIPRGIVSRLTADGHVKVGTMALAALVLLVAALSMCALASRSDNWLNLPAGAVALGYVWVRLALWGLTALLDGLAPASEAVVTAVRASADPALGRALFLALSLTFASLVWRRLRRTLLAPAALPTRSRA